MTLLVFGFPVGYGLIVFIGLTPVNRDFAETPDGVTIYVISNEAHAEFIMPLSSVGVEWTELFPPQAFPQPPERFSHIAVGWGDRTFFIQTPTWDRFQWSTAAKAMLWPTESCLHATLLYREQIPPTARRVTISTEQYTTLAKFIRESVRRDAGKATTLPASTNVSATANDRVTERIAEEPLEPEPIAQDRIVVERIVAEPIAGAHFGTQDAFFEAEGRYHALNTCNSWVGAGLRRAGVAAPWYSPLPQTPYLYLPPSNAAAD